MSFKNLCELVISAECCGVNKFSFLLRAGQISSYLFLLVIKYIHKFFVKKNEIADGKEKSS